MGGLKKYLPITYWTFLIGALAIAGVPPLSGFFSKDEILWRTFTARRARPHAAVGDRHGHVAADRDLHVPAGVPDVPRRAPARRAGGAGASGRRKHGAHGTRTAPPCSARPHRRPRSHGHGHGHGTRSARRAAGDGAPADRAGDRLGRSPATSACRTRSAAATGSRRSSSRRSRRTARPRPTPRPRRTPRRVAAAGSRGGTHADAGTELMLMALSSGVALAGIGLACVLLAAQPQRGRRAGASRFSGAAPAAAEQVLRRRALRRGDRAADQDRCRPAALWKGVDAGADRRHGQRRRALAVRGSERVLRRAADRLGPRLCVVAVLGVGR